MDAVILNYRAGTLPRFASAMRNRLTAVKGKYEIVFTGDGWKEESVNVFRGNDDGWKEESVNVFRGNDDGWGMVMLFIIRWIVMTGHANDGLSILIRPTDRRACNE